MKKTFIITLLVFVLSLCFVFPGFCKGELGDNDAFTTYIGRTRSEVRRIAPVFEELTDNLYCIDLSEVDDEVLMLAVSFDDYNLVQAVIFIMTKGILTKNDIDDSLKMAAYFGAIGFGFDIDNSVRNSRYEDESYVINIKGGIDVVATELSDTTYMVMSVQK